MRKQFEKDSIEMLMFRDFYRIIQDYWIFEDTEAYWQGLIDDMEDFYKKYRDSVPLSRRIGKAFVDERLSLHERKEDVNGYQD